MPRSLLFMLVGMIAAFAAGVARGKECEGVSFPEQVQVEGGALTLNGLGLRQATFLKVNVYVAALYVAQVTADANAVLGADTPKVLTLHFLRDVGAADLNKAWDEGFEKNGREQLSALRDRIQVLKGWTADMKTGQRLTFTHQPGVGIQVDVNGAVKGAIKGDDFARVFLSIWLGAHPPNAGLKTGLLGGACE